MRRKGSFLLIIGVLFIAGIIILHSVTPMMAARFLQSGSIGGMEWKSDFEGVSGSTPCEAAKRFIVKKFGSNRRPITCKCSQQSREEGKVKTEIDLSLRGEKPYGSALTVKEDGTWNAHTVVLATGPDVWSKCSP